MTAIVNATSSKLPNNGQINAADLTGYKTRNIINNVCSGEKINYLEIGLYRGGTFSAALSGNQINAVGIDNWSQNWKKDESPKEVFFDRINKVEQKNNVKIFEADCWSVELEEISNFLNNEKINVYLFDGPHGYQDQYLALKHYYDILADEFILFVDDYTDQIPSSVTEVIAPTQESIKDLKLEKIFEMTFPRGAAAGCHEGLYAVLLKKTQ